MWKWKKKQQIAEAVEETPSSKEEETVDTITEEAPSSEGEQMVSVAAEEAPSAEGEKAVSAAAEEVPPVKNQEKVGIGTGEALAKEEVPSSGVFIFGQKVESGFKKFLTAIFSIFLLPPAIVFGLTVVTAVVLIAFPLISIVLPITLLSLCILFILLPVVLPFITVVSLITGKGKVQFGLENKKFAIRVLGITIPPYAGR